jgi:hypothetical protein
VFTAGALAARLELITALAVGGGAWRTGFLNSGAGSARAAGAASAAFFGGGALLRACTAAGLARAGSGLRTMTFLTAGRLIAFLPFADLGAGLLAGIMAPQTASAS